MAKWTVDPDHSVAAFSIRHMMIANVRGQCNKVTGTIQFDPKDLSRSSVEAEIDVRGLTTGNQKRDEHLMSADFFDVEKHPMIKFKSTGVKIGGRKRGKMTGDLTIRGVTRPVTLDVEYSGPVKAPEGGETSMGFFATAMINQQDFGITWNVPMEGGAVLGKEVRITLDIEADLAE